ncbi:MAG TPA: EamA family transporter, partial [Chloroflexota bacterium]
THLVATYAYVNPVGALLLGWLLLAEPMTLSTLLGSILVLIGITGVFRDQWHQPVRYNGRS